MSMPRLAYVVSRFPVLTQTFILEEILALRELGWPVEIFALHHEREAVAHAAARALEPQAAFPGVSAVLDANRKTLSCEPESWARLLRLTISGHKSSTPALAKALLVFPIAVAWAAQMRALGVCHVHAHFGSYPALAALIAAELQGIGYSFTVHAHDLFADNLMLAEKAERAIFVSTISQYNLGRLYTVLGRDDRARVRLIHCGVDLRVFTFSERRNCEHQHSLLCVAALRDYKGLQHLVHACAMLRASAPDEHLICRIVGDGPQRTALEAQIRAAGLRDTVFLLGAQKQDVVRDLLARSDLFVLPSVTARNGYMDGVPVALMEAMASGVPVIASRLSGIPEIVRHAETGLLVPPGNARALHDAIVRCWRDPAAASERARRGRAHVEREYDVRRNTRELADVFAQIVGQPSVLT